MKILIRFDFEIPFDAAASVTLLEECAAESNDCLTSGGRFELEAGEYHFEYRFKPNT